MNDKWLKKGVLIPLVALACLLVFLMWLAPVLLVPAIVIFGIGMAIGFLRPLLYDPKAKPPWKKDK